jgi:large subunit ribosomal protein L25
MKHATLAAEPRVILGKSVAKLRRAGKLPANIFGHNVQSTAITLDAHDFALLYRHLLATTVIDLRVDGQTRPVLLSRATVDPRSGVVNHVEFKQINVHERVHAAVPVIGIGKAPAVTQEGGVLLQALDAIEVSAMPDELPPSIEVDLSALVDVHAAIYVRDLRVDTSKVQILTPADEVVFRVTASHVHREEAEEPAEASESGGGTTAE